MEDYAADLRALILLGARQPRPVVVGASLGRIAALTAGRCPGLAAGLVLVDVVPRTAPGAWPDRSVPVGGGAGFASLEGRGHRRRSPRTGPGRARRACAGTSAVPTVAGTFAGQHGSSPVAGR
ncbi:hypothetical protein HBB16_16350 [Pseudonocardia sp. MCCB 268]|nr:hypothetical protein [Pseudonocardia cytotoxica]